jgi:hypothetical protein
MDNKNDYLLMAKNITSIIANLNSVKDELDDLTKNFSKGLNSEHINKEPLLKISADLIAVKNDLNDKVLPELKKKSV